MNEGPGWLSPTSAWRVASCPASAVPSARPVVHAAVVSANTGSIAHRAVQTWIESGDWASEKSGERLQSHFDAVLRALGLDATSLSDGVITRARLRRRGPELSRLLSEAGPSSIDTEHALFDESRSIWGVPDITTHGGEGTIIDLKTGRDATRELPVRIVDQLLIYAHLFREFYGSLPSRLVVFSLLHGAIRVDVNEQSLAGVLDRVDRARRSGHGVAIPGPEVCRFCPRRFSCEPHWQMVDAWPRPDAVQGLVTKLETAQSGVTAMQIETLTGSAWVTHIPATSLPFEIALGVRARIVRIHPRGRGAQEVTTEWVADKHTRVTAMQD
jgi:hypothetical protein